MNLEGRTAVVTGGARGIGAATARLLARSGARVIIGDRDEAAGSALAGELNGRFVLADVSRSSDADRLMAEAVDHFGTLDVLVNNAGVVLAKTTQDTSEDEWQRVISINLTGVWLCSRSAIRLMAKQRAGSIVNVASNAGLVGFANAAAYCASKGGVVQLTKAMALDCAPLGIRVNAVCPGHTRTPMAETFVSSQPDPDAFLLDFVGRQHPLGRMAEPEEIAACICFLAGSDSSFMTGAIVPVDGGFTTR